MWLAAGMAVMQGLGAIAGNSQDKAAAREHNKAIQANMKANVMNANHQVAELTRRQQVAQDAATEELIQQRIIAMENEAQVAAAAGESGVTGNSMNTAIRSVQARYGRSAASIMDNVDREIMGLQSQAESVIRDVNQSNKIAAMGAKAAPSGLSQLVNVGTAALGGAQMGMTLSGQLDAYVNKDELKIPKAKQKSRLGKDNR